MLNQNGYFLDVIHIIIQTLFFNVIFQRYVLASWLRYVQYRLFYAFLLFFLFIICLLYAKRHHRESFWVYNIMEGITEYANLFESITKIQIFYTVIRKIKEAPP